MHIIGGLYKGTGLKAPRGIRPTEDRVRKAFFDIFGDMEGVVFLELFSGSGAMGLEAVSRGAVEAVLVEKDHRSLQVIRDNAALVKKAGLAGGIVQALGMDAQAAIRHFFGEKRLFDIIFLDPPYYEGLAEKTLQTLAEYDILQPSGYVAVQHFKKDPVPQAAGPLAVFKQSRYGDSLITLYRKGHE